MTKTKEELMALKKEYETLNKKLKELTEEEIELIVAGYDGFIDSDDYEEKIDYEK